MLHNDTVTLFNRKTGARGQPDTWYPTVISGVHLQIDRAAIVAKYGTESQDSAFLSVPYTVDGENILVAGKPWSPPKEWDKTEDSLTFAGGTDGDFFWKGVWEGGIVADDQYADEGFYAYMNRIHDYVFAVTGVAKYNLIPHFEILGR